MWIQCDFSVGAQCFSNSSWAKNIVCGSLKLARESLIPNAKDAKDVDQFDLRGKNFPFALLSNPSKSLFEEASTVEELWH